MKILLIATPPDGARELFGLGPEAVAGATLDLPPLAADYLINHQWAEVVPDEPRPQTGERKP